MKNFFLPLIFSLLAFPCYVSASDKPYSMCSVAGYYEGNDDRFMQELAMRVVEKNRLTSDTECTAAYKTGKEVAIKFSKPGRVKNQEDAAVIDQAEHFSNLIYDAILSRVKFD
jgi:hypothetical protein